MCRQAGLTIRNSKRDRELGELDAVSLMFSCERYEGVQEIVSMMMKVFYPILRFGVLLVDPWI